MHLHTSKSIHPLAAILSLLFQVCVLTGSRALKYSCSHPLQYIYLPICQEVLLEMLNELVWSKISPSKPVAGMSCLTNWHIVALIKLKGAYRSSLKNKSVKPKLTQQVFLIELVRNCLGTSLESLQNWHEPQKSCK